MQIDGGLVIRFRREGGAIRLLNIKDLIVKFDGLIGFTHAMRNGDVVEFGDFWGPGGSGRKGRRPGTNAEDRRRREFSDKRVLEIHRFVVLKLLVQQLQSDFDASALKTTNPMLTGLVEVYGEELAYGN